MALKDLSPGTALDTNNVVCRERIPAGHKVTIRKINAHDPIRKYGQIIGFASGTMGPGHHVHTHNVEILDFVRDYAIGKDARPTEFVPEADRAKFDGILREDGRVATRNYTGVSSTVNCSASVSRFIADSFTEDMLAGFPNVDGVFSLGHGTGGPVRLLNEALKPFGRCSPGPT